MLVGTFFAGVFPDRGALVAQLHMGLTVWDPYGRVYMGKPVYIPHWAHIGLLYGPRIGSYIGVPLMASPYASYTGPIWDCYLG